MAELTSLRPVTTFDLPADLARDGERTLRSLHGLYRSKADSNPNNGEVAQFCALLAILEHYESGEPIKETRTGVGSDASNTVLRDMSGGALLFVIQRLWPSPDRDESQMRRETQYLINRGAEILRTSRLADLSRLLEENLEGALDS